MYELQLAELEREKADIAAVWNLDILLESSIFGAGAESLRCCVCGTRLALDHFGPCGAQEKHAALRLLAPPVAAQDVPVFDSPAALKFDAGTVCRTEQPKDTCFVSAHLVLQRLGKIETMFGLETPENETPPAALRYLNERSVPALDWTAVAKLEQLLRKNAAEQRRAAMLRDILAPLNSRSRAANRLHLLAHSYSELVTPELLTAAAAALAAAGEQRSKQDAKRGAGAVEQVAGGKIAAALSGGSSAYLLAQWQQRSERKAVAYAQALAAGETTEDARKAALAVWSVQAMGTHTAAMRVKSGRVTSGSVLAKPQVTALVGRSNAGGRPKGKRKNSKVMLYSVATGEKVLIGKVNSGNGQVAKMRVVADKNTLLYSAADLAVLAELQGKRGGASSKKRKALHTVVALRAALASW